LLELISISDGIGSPEFAAAVEQARAGVDPDVLVARAIQHTLAPALADFIVAADLPDLVPGDTRRQLTGMLQLNAYRTDMMVAEAQRVVAEFDRRGLRVACTKGVVLQSTVYDGRIRYFGDVDLMIHPDDTAATTEILTGLGYSPGVQYDHRSQSLVPLPRETVLMYRLYPDHLPHFTRLLDDAPFPYYMVDVAYSLTWYGSVWQIPMDEVMDGIERVPVKPGRSTDTLPAPAAPYRFLFLALHLFREGWFERTVRGGDVRLTQFADIVRQWRRLAPADQDHVRSLVKRYELGPALAWVCHHVDAVFGTALLAEHGDLDQFADPAWLGSVAGSDGGHLAWHGDMRRRLSERVPVELVAAPEVPYARIARQGRR
jgi:hypothetical protein